MAAGLFITGTSTGVGKTYIAAQIARSLCERGLRVGVYKPVASGCERRDGRLISADALALWDAAGRPGTLEQVCPQMFPAFLSPHLAARAEGRRLDPELLRDALQFWRETSDIVLIEGAGGLMSPISDHDYNADLAGEFGYPLVVVSANELGTINDTLQTLIAAAAYQNGVRNHFLRDAVHDAAKPMKQVPDTFLRVAGIVLNSPRRLTDDPSTTSNAAELARRCEPPLLAVVEHGGTFDRPVDWLVVAGLVMRSRREN